MIVSSASWVAPGGGRHNLNSMAPPEIFFY